MREARLPGPLQGVDAATAPAEVAGLERRLARLLRVARARTALAAR